MKALTKNEEKVMHLLWQLKRALVKDIIAKMPDPKPPYNTISSMVRVLEKKGFVGHKAYGKTHEYFPIISKTAYRQFMFRQLLGNYFDGSYQQLVSFFAKEEKVDVQKLKNLLDDLETDADA